MSGLRMPGEANDYCTLRTKGLLWEMMRETKSPRPLCRKQEFYYASRLKGDKFSELQCLISVRRRVIYPPG
jgi:hypothetical protein